MEVEEVLTEDEARRVVAVVLYLRPKLDIAVVREISFSLCNYIGELRANGLAETEPHKTRIANILEKGELPKITALGKGSYRLDFE